MTDRSTNDMGQRAAADRAVARLAGDDASNEDRKQSSTADEGDGTKQKALEDEEEEKLRQVRAVEEAERAAVPGHALQENAAPTGNQGNATPTGSQSTTHALFGALVAGVSEARAGVSENIGKMVTDVKQIFPRGQNKVNTTPTGRLDHTQDHTQDDPVRQDDIVSTPLDSNHAPYVLYGLNILTQYPLRPAQVQPVHYQFQFPNQNGDGQSFTHYKSKHGVAASGFEMCVCYFQRIPAPLGAGGPNKNTSRIQHQEVKFKPHFIRDVFCSQPKHV